MRSGSFCEGFVMQICLSSEYILLLENFKRLVARRRGRGVQFNTL